MSKLVTTFAFIAVSSLSVLGCAVDPATSSESVENSKLPLVAHVENDKLALVGVYDDASMTVRISGEVLGYVRSIGAGEPTLVVGSATYPLDSGDTTALSDELDVGDTIELMVRGDKDGTSYVLKLDLTTQSVAAEAEAQTQLPMELVYCN